MSGRLHGMHGRRALLAMTVLASALSIAGPAGAATFRVDDSRTIVGAPVTPMKWRQFVPGKGADHTVEGELKVAVHLDLSPWMNRPARIYMALAPGGDGLNVRAQWQTQGRLLAGQVVSGSRTLVYEGVVTQPVLQENILLRLSTDGRQLGGTQPLQFYFEIDVPS